MSRPRKIFAEPPAQENVAAWLSRRAPGSGSRMSAFRAGLLDFAASPTCRTLLLSGVGHDRLGWGRAAAGARTAMLLKADAADRLLQAFGNGVGPIWNARSLAGWYAELDAGALRDIDAVEELTGRPGTPEVARPGVFERAMILGGDRTILSELTGGLVCLAEPSDLPVAAQGVAAAVIAGAPFRRVGPSVEGEDYLSFDGTTLLTAERMPDVGDMRQDLYAAAMARVVEAPRVSQLADEFDSALRIAIAAARREGEAFLERVALAEDSARDYWRAATPKGDLPLDARRLLESVDWNANGEWPGLIAAVRSILEGRPVQVVLDELDARRSAVSAATENALLAGLDAVLEPTGAGLAAQVREVERRLRRDLKDVLTNSPTLRERIARRLGLDPQVLLRQLAQLDRVRSGSVGQGETK